MQMAKIFSCKISAHRYYTETPHEFNILTSFLNRIWVQLSESFSELKIGWFLWHLDQKIVLTLIVNFYRARIGAQLHTDITSVFNVTIDAFNWLSQQLFILPVMLQVFSLDHFQVVLPKLIIWVKISWDHPQEIFNHYRFRDWQNIRLMQIGCVSEKNIGWRW